MKNFTLLICFCLVINNLKAQNISDVKRITADYNSNEIINLQIKLKQKALLERQKALRLAKINNWPIRIVTPEGKVEELIKIGYNGMPIY
jgi:hypothetical protein